MIDDIRNDILEIFNPSDQLSIARSIRLVNSIVASSVYSTFASLFCARNCRSGNVKFLRSVLVYEDRTNSVLSNRRRTETKI